MRFQRLIITSAVGLVCLGSTRELRAGRFFHGHGSCCGNYISTSCGGGDSCKECSASFSGEEKVSSVKSASEPSAPREILGEPHGDVFTLNGDIYYLETGPVGRKTVYKLDKTGAKNENGHLKWEQYSEPLLPAGEKARSPQETK
jgi:hypothetical protein